MPSGWLEGQPPHMAGHIQEDQIPSVGHSLECTCGHKCKIVSSDSWTVDFITILKGITPVWSKRKLIRPLHASRVDQKGNQIPLFLNFKQLQPIPPFILSNW